MSRHNHTVALSNCGYKDVLWRGVSYRVDETHPYFKKIPLLVFRNMIKALFRGVRQKYDIIPGTLHVQKVIEKTNGIDFTGYKYEEVRTTVTYGMSRKARIRFVPIKTEKVRL